MTALDPPGIVESLRADALRWQALGLVAALDLPQGCIGAGFIRNLIWDRHHGRQTNCRLDDIDVLWFDRDRTGPQHDRALEATLARHAPQFRWSVRNQARMHERNGDAPYTSVIDAMRHWPETATAIAAARQGEECRLWAPFGIADLMGLILRPCSDLPARMAAFDARIESRKWRQRWPDVRIIRQLARSARAAPRAATNRVAPSPPLP
ncbi:MAG: nucleotidyltransferase family protein [Pararhodobacter sp.]